MTVEETKQERVQPQIYVACLASYNSGIHHGEWIDADQEPDDLKAAVHEILECSPITGAEEYAIHDYDDFFGISLDEYSSLESVSAIARFITKHGELGALVLGYYGQDIDEATKALADQYRGSFKSVEEFAQELTEETTTIPQNLKNYIDYESMVHDMELNGDIFTLSTKDRTVHVFWTS